ncbi:hypothetical protein YB2330_006273 [Saitoella coloradoensis]
MRAAGQQSPEVRLPGVSEVEGVGLGVGFGGGTQPVKLGSGRTDTETPNAESNPTDATGSGSGSAQDPFREEYLIFRKYCRKIHRVTCPQGLRWSETPPQLRQTAINMVLAAWSAEGWRKMCVDYRYAEKILGQVADNRVPRDRAVVTNGEDLEGAGGGG